MRFAALLVGLVVTIALGAVVYGAVLDDDPSGKDDPSGDEAEALGDAGVDPGSVASDAVASTVPAAVCAADARTVEAAVAVFEATGGRAPTSVRDLVDAGHLAEASDYSELAVAADGTVTVVPVPDAGCA